MSEDDHSTIQQNSGQDCEREENSVPKKESEDIDDEGYRTPTYEENKIPKVVLSCPPPPPKRRKRLRVNGRNMKKVAAALKFRFVVDSDSDIDSFFKSFDVKSHTAAPPPPPAVVDTDTDESSSTKRRHIDK